MGTNYIYDSVKQNICSLGIACQLLSSAAKITHYQQAISTKESLMSALFLHGLTQTLIFSDKGHLRWPELVVLLEEDLSIWSKSAPGPGAGSINVTLLDCAEKA